MDTLVRLPFARLPRRRAIVEITSERLLSADLSEGLFFECWREVDKGVRQAEHFESLIRFLLRSDALRPFVPEDASIVGVQHDLLRGRTLVAIEHPSLCVVPEGTELPWLGRSL